MLQIKKYTPTTVTLFYKDASYVINEHELNDAQCQIAEQSLEGAYIMWEGQKITINSDGELSKWPAGMYDTTQRLFARLFQARQAKK